MTYAVSRPWVCLTVALFLALPLLFLAPSSASASAAEEWSDGSSDDGSSDDGSSDDGSSDDGSQDDGSQDDGSSDDGGPPPPPPPPPPDQGVPELDPTAGGGALAFLLLTLLAVFDRRSSAR